MADNLEHRLALQAGRGIAAIEVIDQIHDLALEAQASRDEAHIRFSRAREQADSVFTSRAIGLVNKYMDMVVSLRDPGEYDDIDDDE